MEDQEDRWDEFIDGALFTINTNTSSTTKYSPFFLMFGRKPRLPFEVEKTEQPITGPEELTDLMEEFSREDLIREHVDEMSKMRDSLFPRVDKNIKVAQNKQRQYNKKRGQSSCPFKVGDLVLQRNMLQSTKAGYKFQDQWLGPYKITYLNAENGTCRLANQFGKNLTKLASVKNVKPYRQPSINEPSQDPVSTQQPSASNSHTPPVPKPRNKVPVPIQVPPKPKPRPRTKFLRGSQTPPIPKPRNIQAGDLTTNKPKVHHTNQKSSPVARSHTNPPEPQPHGPHPAVTSKSFTSHTSTASCKETKVGNLVFTKLLFSCFFF